MFLLGIFTKRANRQGIYIGIAACVIFTAYAVITSTPLGTEEEEHLLFDLGRYNFTHHKYMLGVYSHIILFVVGYIASLFFKNVKNINHLTYAGWLENKRKNNVKK